MNKHYSVASVAEDIYAQQQLLEYHLHSKQVRLIAMWAADKIGFESQEDIKNYVDDIVASFAISNNNDQLPERIERDLKKKNIQVTIDEILQIAQDRLNFLKEMLHQ